MNYIISQEASRDLENIWAYTYQTWSAQQADRYLNLLFDEIEYLGDFPLSGKSIEYLRAGYRRSKIKSHFIFYRQITDNHYIEIIRILHYRMDSKAHLSDPHSYP